MIYKSDLMPSVKRKIAKMEKHLNKRCKKLWDFTNKQGETYLFGRFFGSKEETIVTIAVRCDVCVGGWNPF